MCLFVFGWLVEQALFGPGFLREKFKPKYAYGPQNLCQRGIYISASNQLEGFVFQQKGINSVLSFISEIQLMVAWGVFGYM